MHHLIDVRNEDGLGFDDQGIATLYASADASIAYARVLPGVMGMQGLSAPGAEDNAYVLSGMLAYPVAGKPDVFVARGAWIVARPGELQGYVNKGGKPATLLLFRPKSSARAAPGQQRIFLPSESAVMARATTNRSTAYETPGSRGEAVTLHPGEPTQLAPSLCTALLVTEGRMMALFNREKVSLDHGEGLVFVREQAEVIGVGGLSRGVIFSTR